MRDERKGSFFAGAGQFIVLPPLLLAGVSAASGSTALLPGAGERARGA